MPWRPLPRIAFAICSHPFHPTSPADLPLQLGDELYIIEQGGKDGEWYRGYLVAPPSLLSGLTSSKGQPLEARVFSGIFPGVCVEIRELLGEVLHPTGHQETLEQTSDSQTSVGNAPSQAVPSAVSAHGPSGITAYGQKPAAPVPMLKIGDESATSEEEPLVDEIASCLREWHSTNLHELLLGRSYDLLEEMSTLVTRLDTARRQLMHKILTVQEVEAVRQSAIWDLVQGNKILNGEVIVRSSSNRGRIVTYQDSAIEVSRLQSTMSLLSEPPLPQAEPRSLHHLLLEIKNVAISTGASTTLVLSLYTHNAEGNLSLISEPFALDTAAVMHSPLLARTLFTDLNAFDADDTTTGNNKLYLVVVLVTTEPARGTLSRVQQQHMSSDGTYFAGDFTNGAAKSMVTKGSRRSFLWSQPRPSTDLSILASSPEAPQRSSQGDLLLPKERKYLKRATGVGVLDITGLVKERRPVEQELVIWSPMLEDEASVEQEPTWDSVLASLLPTSSNRYQKSSVLTALSVNLTMFMNQDSGALIKTTPTLLQNITTSQRLGFPGTPVRPRSDIYVTLLGPFVPPNAVLSHPRAGNAPLPSDLAMEDLQITLEIRNAAGDRIENCIYASSNSIGHVAWRTTAVSAAGAWNQTIKLAIRPEDVPGSHMVMSIADAGAFPFALAWMPLWTHGAFVRDGDHSLALHKYDEVTSSIIGGKGAYLALPWTWKLTDESVLGPGAAIRLRTYLCSTSYSQDPNLLVLLRWRDQRAREVASILRRFQFVPEIEIVKLLHEVFDALFEILVEYGGNDEIEDLVFDSLVRVLGITYDRRFDLQPLVEGYADSKFRFPFAFPCLTKAFLRLLSDPTNQQSSRRLHAASKVGHHIFKFMVRARQQQIAKEAEIGIRSQNPAFTNDLQHVFKAINDLMRNPAPILIGTKTIIVQNFHSWLPQVVGAFTPSEGLETACRFIDSCESVQGRLIMYKLVLINQLLLARHFLSLETQSMWSAKVVEWLSPYWGTHSDTNPQWKDQVRLCCAIMATYVEQEIPVPSACYLKLIESYFVTLALPQLRSESFTLLFPKAYPFPAKRTTSKEPYNEALIEMAALLSIIATRPTTYSGFQGIELKSTLSNILRIQNSILACEAYPLSWFSLYIYHHKSILQTLEVISEVLIQSCLPSPEDADAFPTDLWLTFFSTLLRVVSSDALALETFPEQKRRAVWKIAGDVREAGAELLRRNWEAIGWDASPLGDAKYGIRHIGGYQVQYVPSLVGPVLELCLSVHEGLRSAAIAVLQTMIVSEWTLAEDLAILQAEMINKLDELFRTRGFTDSVLQKFFLGELLTVFRPGGTHPDQRLFAAVEALCDVIDHLLDLLVAVHSTKTAGEASHIIDTLRLTSFLRDMHREDIFISYVHKLAEVQASGGNLAEAGLALKMHADLYDWNTMQHVPALREPTLPEQTAFERKEKLYFEMIKHFEEGCAWDLALGAYHELEHEYEFTVFDLAKLARAQRAMATIYEAIAKEPPRVPRYFWVSFRGLGFPASLRDKQFIFESLSTDRTSTFIDRMQQLYPNAHLVGRGAVDDLEGQFVTIVAVSPQKNLVHPVNRQPKVNQHIREHYMYAQPRHFTTSTRRQTSKAAGNSDVAEKIMFTTAEAFPTMLKRSEIVETMTIRLPPVQTALERTMRKTQELQSLETLASNGGDKAFRALTEALMILINVDSGGSVAEYWSLAHELLMERSEVAEVQLAEALRVALIDHVYTIRHGLGLFSRPAHQATRADLTQVFERTFASVLEYLYPRNVNSFNGAVDPPSFFESNTFTAGSHLQNGAPRNTISHEAQTQSAAQEDITNTNGTTTVHKTLQERSADAGSADIGNGVEATNETQPKQLNDIQPKQVNYLDIKDLQQTMKQNKVIREGPWSPPTSPKLVNTEPI